MRYRQMHAKLLGGGGGGGDGGGDGEEPAAAAAVLSSSSTGGGGGGGGGVDGTMQLSNEISAPYEVPQYPIEQIETKLIR